MTVPIRLCMFRSQKGRTLNRRIWSRWVAITCLACIHLCAGDLLGFTVVKNVNSNKPPVEKVVIFEKGTTNHLTLKDQNNSSKTRITEDGTLEIKITGNAATTSTISWEHTDQLPKPIEPKEYNYILLTCKITGYLEQAEPNNRTTKRPVPSNIYLHFGMYNEKNEQVGMANLANMAEDGNMPNEITTLKFPTALVTKCAGRDIIHIHAIGFNLPSTRPNVSRQLHLVIERISLAD